MIYLDGIGWKYLVSEINKELINRKLSKIRIFDKNNIYFEFNNKNLFIQLINPIMYIREKKEYKDTITPFILSLRKYIEGAILENIETINYDRIVKFTFRRVHFTGDINYYYIFLEIKGNNADILLTDSDYTIISINNINFDITKERNLLINNKYTLPVVEKILPNSIDKLMYNSYIEAINNIQGVGKLLAYKIYNNYELFSYILENYSPCISNNNLYYSDKLIEDKEYISFNTLQEALNYYFTNTIPSDYLNNKKNNLIKFINTKINKTNTIITKINKDIDNNSKNEEYKIKADILLSNIYKINKNIKSIELFDYYNNKNITIVLDTKLNASQNIQSYYNKYNKAKRSIGILSERKEQLLSQINYYESILMYIDKENTIIGLEEIEQEIKPKIRNNKKNKKKRELLMYKYKYNEDICIYVGRNNIENNEITFKQANNNDIWLHVKDIPGSHVVLKNTNDIDIIESAAKVAIYYSKANINDSIEVDYCNIKYVKKIANSYLGNVYFKNNKSILVNNHPDNLNDWIKK